MEKYLFEFMKSWGFDEDETLIAINNPSEADLLLRRRPLGGDLVAAFKAGWGARYEDIKTKF